MLRNRSLMTLMLALVVVTTGLAPALGANPKPLEAHIRDLKAQVRRLAPKPFERKLRNGATERFQITADGYSYVLVDASGSKKVAWSRSSPTHFVYERWYAFPKSQERLMEDDRSISFTSWHKNGQKWEQYTFNKDKKLKSYDVYDEEGKLKP